MHDIVEDGLAADILEPVSIPLLQMVFYLLAGVIRAALQLTYDEVFILVKFMAVIALVRTARQKF